MDDAFHASDRTWISKSYFAGEEEVKFVNKWSKYLSKDYVENMIDQTLIEDDSTESHGDIASKPSISRSSVVSTQSTAMNASSSNIGESSVDAENQNGEDPKRSAVLKEIQALGDELFGIKPKKKKRDVAAAEAGVVENEEGVPMEISSDSSWSDDEELYQSMLAWKYGYENNEDTIYDYYDESSSDDSDFDMELFATENPEQCNQLYLQYIRGMNSLAIGNTKDNDNAVSWKNTALFLPSTSTEFSNVSQESRDKNILPAAFSSTSDNGSQIASTSVLPISTNSANAPGVSQSEKDKGEQIVDKCEFFDAYQLKLIAEKQKALKRDPNYIRRNQKLQRFLGMDDKQYRALVAHSTLGFIETKGIPLVDKPIAIGGVMPVLAPPIPNYALKMNSALAIYANFSNHPGAFQWKCKSVNEQMSDDIKSIVQMKKREEIAQKLLTCSPDEMVNKSKDVIIAVLFYHPSRKDKEPVRPKEPDAAVTINILGSQTLQDLRQCFYCKNDLICPEIKGNDLPVLTISTDSVQKIRESSLDKPCGMFVGSTMYTNLSSRQSEDTNYAQSLMTWAARKRKKTVGPFESADIESTRMIDLTFKLGFPYLFIHQGNCEHIMVIENVRLINSEDSLLVSSYPVVTKPNFKTVYCAVDNKRVARYAVRKMDMFPQDPMIICSECLEQYCYHQKKKVCPFQLYEFHQLSSLF